MKTIYNFSLSIILSFTIVQFAIGQCGNGQLTLSITFDNNPDEFGWEIKDINNTTYAASYVGTYAGQTPGSTVVETIPTLSNGDYVLVVYDSGSNGLCCNNGNGSYTFSDGAGPMFSGSNYIISDVTQFCYVQSNGDVIDTQAPTAPVLTASNVTSTTVDLSWPASQDNVGATEYGLFINGAFVGSSTSLSGTLPNLTPNTTYDMYIVARDLIGNFSPSSNVVTFTTSSSTTIVPTVVHEGFFESGWDGWIDGGSDCKRYSGSRSFEGNYSIRIRDNSGVASSMTSPAFDLSSFNYVEVTFEYFAHGMEYGEDFLLRFNQNGSWVTVDSYVSGFDFTGNGFNSVSVTLPSSVYSFGTNNKFRLQCDASQNNDKIYIDAVRIVGYELIANSPIREDKEESVELIELTETPQIIDNNKLETFSNLNETYVSLEVYPNPTVDLLNVRGVQKEDFNSLSIYDVNGKAVILNQRQLDKIDMSQLDPGHYFVKIKMNEGQLITKSVIKL